jgi:hypothetical protein
MDDYRHNFNWDDEARGAAEVASRGEIAEIDRGALPWDSPGVCVVFGNDGYSRQGRTRTEVLSLWRMLEQHRVEVLGFGISDTGDTWAMLVRHEDYRWLTNVTWTAWRLACKTPLGRPTPKPR